MPEWKIKRGDSEFTAENDEALQLWAKEGRLVESDYVFNPTLQKWMYARETAELAGAFSLKAQRGNKNVGCSLGVLGLLLCLFFWPIGVIVAAAGVIIYGIAESKEKQARTQ